MFIHPESQPHSLSPDRLLSFREAAAILGLSEKGLRQRIVRGDTPPIIRLSERTLRISERDLYEWIRSRTTPTQSINP